MRIWGQLILYATWRRSNRIVWGQLILYGRRRRGRRSNKTVWTIFY
jgi:hypothetical protein